MSIDQDMLKTDVGLPHVILSGKDSVCKALVAGEEHLYGRLHVAYSMYQTVLMPKIIIYLIHYHAMFTVT